MDSKKKSLNLFCILVSRRKMSDSYSQDYERLLRKNQQSFQSEYLSKSNQQSRNSHERHEITRHGNGSQNFDNIPDPGERYQLDDVIGRGVYGTVYTAVDTQAGKVSLKLSGDHTFILSHKSQKTESK